VRLHLDGVGSLMRIISTVTTFEEGDEIGEDASIVQVTREDEHIACQGSEGDDACIGQPPAGGNSAEVGTLLLLWEDGDPLCFACLYSNWTASIVIKPRQV